MKHIRTALVALALALPAGACSSDVTGPSTASAIESQGTLGVPINSQGTLGVPINSQGTLGVPINSQGTLGVPITSQGTLGVPIE